MITIEQLYKIYRNCSRVFTDSRQAEKGGLFFALKGENFDGNNFALKAIESGADYAVVDRQELANNDKCLLVSDVLDALQRLANYHRKQLNIPVLAITGTNGKTTTKELIANVLQQKYCVLATKGNLNNHIGVPLTLLSIQSVHEIAVIEMGANHPGEIDFLCKIAEPDYGIITNVGKAHLEGFGSFEGVKQTKSEMYRYIAANGKGIFINVGNEHLVPLAKANKVQYTYAIGDEQAELFGIQEGADIFLVAKVWFEKGWLYLRSNITGSYNLENILAAARIGLFFKLDPLLIKRGIEDYEPSNNRSQILKKGDVTILLDCYNANPSSMAASLDNFSKIRRANKVVILGDMLELGDVTAVEHQRIVDMLAITDIERVFLVGGHFMKTVAPESFKRYANVESMADEMGAGYFQNCFLLIKGSRGIRLERIVEMI